VPYKIPVVMSALDAVRAFADGQPVGFHETVAMKLAAWGFEVAPAGSKPGMPLVTKHKQAFAANILSDLDYDHAINRRDPVLLQSDDQPGIIVPDLTVFLIGPGRGIPGDGVLAIVARLNPDGTSAYTNPLGVPMPGMSTGGMTGFGQLVPGIMSANTVVATIPLPTELSSQGEFNVTAGHVLAFTGSTAGQLLGKIPFVGSGIALAQSAAELAMGEGTAHQWIQFFVDVAKGGGGIAGTFARVAIPGLSTIQVFADFTSGDWRQITQGIVTLALAPLAAMFGPAGSAGQEAGRFLSGKIFDYFAGREADAAAEVAGLESGMGVAPGEIAGEAALQYQYAQQKAVEQGLLQQVMLQEAEATTALVFGDLATQQAQAAQDIVDVTSALTAPDGTPPTVEAVAAATGQDIQTVADITGQPVLPPLEESVPTPVDVLGSDLTLQQAQVTQDIVDVASALTAPDGTPPTVEAVAAATGQDIQIVADTLAFVDVPVDVSVPVEVPVDESDITGQPVLPPLEESAPVEVVPVVEVTPAPAPYTGPRWPGTNVGVWIPCDWNPYFSCVVYFGEAEFYAYVTGGGVIRG
jgi:hypothetical protein